MRCKPLEIRTNSKGKFGVHRGASLLHNFKTKSAALNWKWRQECEDYENRLGKVRAYLDERAARPAVAIEPTTQMDLF